MPTVRVTETRTSGTTTSAQTRSISASASSRVASSGERRSTWSSHRSATTFDLVPSDHADVARHTGPAAVQPLEREDRVGRLEDRVVTLLRFDAGVRRASLDRDREVGDPLPGRDDVPVRPCALQHEGRVVRRGELADQRTRPRGADLLVGVAHVRDRAERVEADVLEHVGREEPREQAGLHVGHPRTRPPDRRRSGTAAPPRSHRRRPCPCGRRAGCSDHRPRGRMPITRSTEPRRAVVRARSTSQP